MSEFESATGPLDALTVSSVLSDVASTPQEYRVARIGPLRSLLSAATVGVALAFHGELTRPTSFLIERHEFVTFTKRRLTMAEARALALRAALRADVERQQVIEVQAAMDHYWDTCA